MIEKKFPFHKFLDQKRHTKNRDFLRGIMIDARVVSLVTHTHTHIGASREILIMENNNKKKKKKKNNNS